MLEAAQALGHIETTRPTRHGGAAIWTTFCRGGSGLTRGHHRALPYADLPALTHEQKWELMLSDAPDQVGLELLNGTAPAHSGTTVLWTKVDRLMKDYQAPDGASAKKALQKRVDALREHIAATYQRFLDPQDSRARNVTIRLDGTPVAPWDPFQKGLSELLVQDTVTVKGPDAPFTVRAFILPRREEFPSDELAKAAKLSSDRQGLYIYRQDRLIHAADWLGMYQQEPHSTLLRVEFSFDHRLDDVFHLDIKKSKIILNDALWTWLKETFLPAPRREANRRYRIGQKADVAKTAKGAHDASNRTIANKEADVGGATVAVSNPNTNEVVVTNQHGKFTLILPIGHPTKPGEVYVQPVENIDDGLLFEPAFIDGHKAVRINISHPYYHKVYVPNLAESVTVQGIEFLAVEPLPCRAQRNNGPNRRVLRGHAL